MLAHLTTVRPPEVTTVYATFYDSYSRQLKTVPLITTTPEHARRIALRINAAPASVNFPAVLAAAGQGTEWRKSL